MKRVISALVILAVLVGTLWWLPSWVTFVLAEIVVLLALIEYARLAERVGMAVPTGIVAHRNRIFVAFFAGFPFISGSGLIVSVPKVGGHLARVEVENLNTPVDVLFAFDETLLIIEHGKFDLATADFIDGTGKLTRVNIDNGNREVIASGLTKPIAIALESTVDISSVVPS